MPDEHPAIARPSLYTIRRSLACFFPGICSIQAFRQLVLQTGHNCGVAVYSPLVLVELRYHRVAVCKRYVCGVQMFIFQKGLCTVRCLFFVESTFSLGISNSMSGVDLPAPPTPERKNRLCSVSQRKPLQTPSHADAIDFRAPRSQRESPKRGSYQRSRSPKVTAVPPAHKSQRSAPYPCHHLEGVLVFVSLLFLKPTEYF